MSVKQPKTTFQPLQTLVCVEENLKQATEAVVLFLHCSVDFILECNVDKSDHKLVH